MSEIHCKPAIGPRLDKPDPKDPYHGPPKPFSFKYGVVDADSGSNFDHAQQQDQNGVVTGTLSTLGSFDFSSSPGSVLSRLNYCVLSFK